MFLEDRLLEKLKGITVNTENAVFTEAMMDYSNECLNELKFVVDNHRDKTNKGILMVIKSTIKRINNTCNTVAIKRADLYLKKRWIPRYL